MKRKLLLSILTAGAAALMPLASPGQVTTQDEPAAPAAQVYKYKVYAGWGYTSINQVSGSRSGLQGIDASVTRNWGRLFGVTAQGGHYAWAVTSSNVGNPTVDMFLAGPELHGNFTGRLEGFIHGLMGVVHTGGVSISPSASFAGGVGLGMDYAITPRMAIRLTGDDIASSFSVVPYQPGFSPHRRWNAHAGFGVVYRF